MQKAKILRELIEKTGMNLKAFAEKADMPYTTLYSILERGVGKASVDNIIKICKALNITIDDLEKMAANEETDLKNLCAKNKITTIAAHLPDDVELTDEDIKQINDFIQFVISKKKEQK